MPYIRINWEIYFIDLYSHLFRSGLKNGKGRILTESLSLFITETNQSSTWKVVDLNVTEDTYLFSIQVCRYLKDFAFSCSESYNFNLK